jgi:hypothetical protein
MRIYVTNVPPSSIKSNIKRIEPFLINKNGFKKYEIFSEEFGTHIIENKPNNKNLDQSIYRIEPITKMDLHLTKNYNGYDLLFDKTEYVNIPLVSQFPVNYTLTKLTCFEYSTNKSLNTKCKADSDFKLVIECVIETNSLMEKDIIPINFYFSSPESKSNNIDNNLLEKINMFLLELI